MLGSTEKKFDSSLPCSLPLSKETKGLRIWLLIFGLRFLEENKNRQRFAKFMTITYAFVWLAFTGSVGRKAILYKEKREVCLVVFFFLVCALISWITLHRNLGEIQQTLSSICIFFKEKDLKIMRKDDFFLFLITLFLVLTANVVVTIYMFYNLDHLRIVMRRNGGPSFWLSDTLIILRGFSFFFSYGAVIGGIMCCSTGLYAMIMTIFKLFCYHIKEITLEVMNNMTAKNICVVRKHLRIYWTVKTKMDKLINIFPFIWLSYSFVGITILFTLMIVEWKQDTQNDTFMVLACYITFHTWLCFLFKFCMFDGADRAFQETMQTVFGLTDPRFKPYVMDEDVTRQIHFLHLELTNCPNSYNTILGMVRFSRKTIINYIAALVNFAVMMINIRMAIKGSNWSTFPSYPPCNYGKDFNIFGNQSDIVLAEQQ